MKESERRKMKKQKIKEDCIVCNGMGWYYVNNWIGSLQGRKDCECKKVQIKFGEQKLEF